MAQTKRKRKSKHRGNAAGMIETRGRTGRPLTAAEKTADKRAQAALARADRLNRPPTWRSSMNRAAIATVIFVIALMLIFRESFAQTIALAGFIFLLYIPLGYYTDLFLYRWRQKRKVVEPQKGGRD
ncbi:hypothetical protein DSM112329_03123 [Paraconexibacter sp. AEG42_29]|uniref:DUF3043 domain-containing protein n=1 Tax=Paraconexibacter sp. AEG42_29 TaxID=2997339 RepID=A0AAU7AY62_9ACTN